MNKQSVEDITSYYKEARSWSSDRERLQRSSLRIAWIVATVATLIAFAEAIALAALAPLKTVVPYTLLVDRQTGYVQELKPLEREIIAPDRALTRSFLAQYVIAREGFQIESLKSDYRKVALWSASEARERYVAAMQASNPASPLASLPRNATVDVEIRSVSSLSENTALVRFVTYVSKPGGTQRQATPWSAVVTYRYSGAPMRAADRLINPLGFQVVRYRRNAEIAPEPVEEASPAPPSTNATPIRRPQ